ncbi:uncharacterized protein LOC127748986 [Frankliniella occidentalis]|uniref:Uncharacterized protein LOC127748986 n=1 Tax=Frankliniella occidentalis TaxID=133901 RepID=A0A9C6WM69_FRAOC|nr:uncharacterized protein LOC127748986 [Frankliniella occidentalis]
MDTVCKNFTSEDCVVIIGGTNDIQKPTRQNCLDQVSTKVTKLSKETNVIIAAVPWRLDTPHLNLEIDKVNTYLYGKVKENICQHGNSDNVCYSTSMVDLERKYYSRSGLHLNSRGKKIISHRFAKQIKAISNNEREKNF